MSGSDIPTIEEVAREKPREKQQRAIGSSPQLVPSVSEHQVSQGS